MAVSVTIWHNPRCSKSRETLALLRERGVEPEIRLYLEDAPTEAELRAALAALGISAIGLVRRGEAAWKALGLGMDAGEAEIVAAMAAQPVLIERPVVFSGDRARLGRPPEAVLDLL